MKNIQNIMVLNGENIGISKIELNEADLLITDKSCKYCFKVCLKYDWKKINSVKVGEKKNIDFSEYYLSENNEPALIWPSKCYIEKISDSTICFWLKFNDLSGKVTYMNKRGCFDIELNNLEIKVFIDYNDATGDSIIYNFN